MYPEEGFLIPFGWSEDRQEYRENDQMRFLAPNATKQFYAVFCWYYEQVMGSHEPQKAPRQFGVSSELSNRWCPPLGLSKYPFPTMGIIELAFCERARYLNPSTAKLFLGYSETYLKQADEAFQSEY